MCVSEPWLSRIGSAIRENRLVCPGIGTLGKRTLSVSRRTRFRIPDTVARNSSPSMSSRFEDGRRDFTLSSESAPPKESSNCPFSSTRKLGGMKRSSRRS